MDLKYGDIVSGDFALLKDLFENDWGLQFQKYLTLLISSKGFIIKK